MLWIPSEKCHRDNRATRWVCEWWSIPKRFNGKLPEDFPLDQLDYNKRSFGPKGKGLAVSFAGRLEGGIKDAMFGVAVVKRERIEHIEATVGEWEPIDDTAFEVDLPCPA